MSDWWESALLCRETVAEDTVACVLRRPAGFHFAAGQYVELKLPLPAFTDALGATRAMSIASAPSDDDLVLLMRIRDSAFKRSIMMLPAGAPLLLDGPADDLTFDMGSAAPAVLIAGGVGIAPFRALLREAAAEMCTLDGAVFYSNRRPEDAPFLDELSSLSATIGLQFVPTMTRMADAKLPWAGETVRLGAAMIHRHVDPARHPRYYVSGSTLFVSGLCYGLEQAGVPARDIRIEMYPGY
jgi:ferredoxin-NADP reductase